MSVLQTSRAETIMSLEITTAKSGLHVAPQVNHHPKVFPHVLPQTPQKPEKHSHCSGVDSGYASQDVTPSGETVPGHLANPAPSSPSRLSHSIRIAQRLRRKRQLRLFDDIAIPEATYNRFQDLQLKFGKPLSDFLWSRCCSPGHVSAKLLVMGENRETAKPCVIVHCEKPVAAKIRQFFKKENVKSQYQPRDGGSRFPSLEVFVHPCPLLQMAVWLGKCSWDGNSTPEPVLASAEMGYGRKMSVIGKDERVATLGGFIVVSHGTHLKVYGMTVGHAFQTDPQNPTQHPEIRGLDIVRGGVNAFNRNNTDIDKSEDWKEYNDEDEEDNDGDDDDLVSLELSSEQFYGGEDHHNVELDTENRVLHPDHSSEDDSRMLSVHYSAEAFETTSSRETKDCVPPGERLYVSNGLGLGEVGEDRDWALLELRQEALFHQDSETGQTAPTIDIPSINYQGVSFESAFNRSVIILSWCGTTQSKDSKDHCIDCKNSTEDFGNHRHGYLGPRLSFLMLSSGRSFTETYSLRFSDSDGGWLSVFLVLS